MRVENLKKPFVILAGITLGLTMTACGGGSTGSSVSAGSTQPPPPPPKNISLADLQYSETFNLASAVMSFDVTPLGQGENHSFASGNVSSSTTLSYNANNDSYTLKIIQGGLNYQEVFATSDIDAGASSGALTTYEKPDHSLILLNPHAAPLDLEYVTMGAWVSPAASSVYDLSIGFGAGGVQTSDADMPTSGSASYEGEITGTGITKPLGSIYLVTGTIDIEADFGTGNITSTVVTLRTSYLSGQTFAPYMFESNGSLSGSTNLFGGTIESLDGSNLVGRVDGAFFGPNAEEVGGAFSASNSNDDMVGIFVAGPAGP